MVEENKIIANNNPKSEGKFSPYQVKLSCIFMGVGQLFCKQFTKGILLILLEIAFILFLAFSGVSNIIGIFTDLLTMQILKTLYLRRKKLKRDIP